MVDAGLQHDEELALVQGPLGISPVLIAIAEVAVGNEHQVFELRVIVGTRRDLAGVAAKLVDQFVLEDADEPGLELRSAGKRLRLFERGEHGVGHGVFGPGVVAQLGARESQQLGSQDLDLTGKITHPNREEVGTPQCKDWQPASTYARYSSSPAQSRHTHRPSQEIFHEPAFHCLVCPRVRAGPRPAVRRQRR